MRSIYLDYNATTPLAPVTQEAMLPYLADRFADPLGEHTAGRVVAEAIEDARAKLAMAIGAAPDEIVWTSSGTEASNLALRGLVEPVLRAGETPHLIVSAVDHAAVQGPARFLSRLGADLTVVEVDKCGHVSPDAITEALRPSTRLVSVVHANEEIGVVQPIAEIATICRSEGVLFHTDAAQSLAKLPLDVRELDIDLMSLSAHKAYGPKGVGALYVRRGVPVEPQLWGASHESGQRAGMPNVAGLVGFGAIAGVAQQCLGDSTQRLRTLTNRLEQRLIAGAEDSRLYGPSIEHRLAGTLCVALPRVAATDLLAAVPELCAASCASGDPSVGVSLSPTLRAIGAEPAEAAGAMRLSLGWYTEESEIETAADALLAAWERLRS
ncbi:cysteine desulfurase family protein [Botrimarina mediterranea]|uniref:cysteine desulfurase n=1 Tax=Botrimarina mediterranea TaxID=2528022 RepID=A0A518K3P2_9BACT|nr:cysteine desulfurase family protein [Botrimarina mediterranea]QDV72421.1 Cysteine desulfurase [Botrimarina mediterranea]QDV76967.1 Cysteine desulfurase [Planctomycetes bacterium K2D]